MAYNNNIPQPADTLSQSQADLLNNFMAIYNLINENHVNFDVGDQGKHKWVTFPAQGTNPPGGAFNVGEVGAFAFLNTITNQNELYINKKLGANVTNTQIPATASILSTNSSPLNNTSGWTYLPSGLLLKWGNANANGITFVPFPTSAAIPVFTEVVSVQLTTYANSIADTNTFVRLSGFSNLGINCYGSQRTTVTDSACSFQYLAIGY